MAVDGVRIRQLTTDHGRLAVSLLLARRSTRSRFGRRRLTNHRRQQLSQPAACRAFANSQLRHLRKAQLRVRKRQASQRLPRRRHQVIELVPVPDLHSTPLQQLELPIKCPQANPQFREDHRSRSRRARQESNQTMQPSRSLKRDVNRRSASRCPWTGHVRARTSRTGRVMRFETILPILSRFPHWPPILHQSRTDSTRPDAHCGMVAYLDDCVQVS